MIRTNIIRLLIAGLVTAGMTACDFLHEESETKYTAQYIYETEEGLELAVTALYALDRDFQDRNEGATVLALRRATDLAVTNGGTGNFYGEYNPTHLKASAAQPKHMWQGMYNIIGKCNDIVTAASKLPESDRLNYLVAQARAYRAQCYFLLYRTFDRIWLNTLSTTPENVNDKRVYRPATKEEVFRLLYEDLGFAVRHLEWRPEETGRFTRAAARHILADVAMWNEDYELALAQADSIENSGAGYRLVGVDEIFKGENLNHDEALLVQQWSRNPGGNLAAGGAAPTGHYYAAWYIAPYRTSFGGDQYCSYDNWAYGWGRCYPSPYLFSLYDKVKDKRYEAFYIHRYKNTKNEPFRGVQPGGYVTMQNGGSIDKNLYPGCIKYGDIWTRTTTEQQSYKDIIVYRLAETYILAAEAAVRLNKQDLARKYYNKTWMRAGNDEFTGAVTLDMVMDEQARELALEGQRWYYLKRCGKLIEQVKKYAGDPRIPSSVAGRVNLPKNPHFVRWPIPESEVINMGPQSFPQNEGYK